MPIRTIAAVAFALLAGTTLSLAATKDDAVAMVKKAVAAIKADGVEKTYAAISAPGGKYVDGEIYVVVNSLEGVTVAHATNPKLIGRNMAEEQDVDGKYFAKDMNALARKQASFWYDFKFVNPATKKIQVKDYYCESLDSTRVCAGVYRP
ncbi:MAG: cache domain-containing protein [Rhizobiales bacterium]|nr:cache domain-containing protein [Hyphomicrobiales bacterium]